MVLVSFILVTGFAAATGLLIIKARSELRGTLPVIAGAYPITAFTNNALPLLLVKGPALQAAPSEEVRDKFMADSFEMLLSSPGIADAVAKLGQDSSTTLLAFLTPGNNWFGGAHRDFRQARVNVLIFAIKSPIVYNGNNFREFRKSWQINQMIRAEEASYDRFMSGLDPVAGEITTEPYDPRMEERIDFLLSGL
jgi:ribosomal protein L20